MRTVTFGTGEADGFTKMEFRTDGTLMMSGDFNRNNPEQLKDAMDMTKLYLDSGPTAVFAAYLKDLTPTVV